MTDLTPSQIASVNAAYWAKLKLIKLANGCTFTFEDRAYLVEPMTYVGGISCSMKATGGGFSECQGILPSIHGMINGRYPQGVGYYFPTDTDMQDYVKSRFNPLISDNYEAIGKYVKKGRSGTDSAGLKRIGNSNLYLRGSTLSPGADGGARKSTKVQGIQIDRLVVDEIDQIESEAIAKMRHRMDNAAIDGIKGKREERYIANPSDEDRGIDLYWQKSDQRFWWSKCECGHFTCAIKEFMDDPEKSVGIYSEGEKKGTGYMKCTKCSRPLGFNHGEYRADYPGREIVCWHWSHLTSAYNDPVRVLRDYRNPPEGNLGDIIRLDLGLAYSSSDEKLRKDAVYACCGNDGMLDSSSDPCAMGVDNDDGKHVVIGIKTDSDRYEIIKTARVDGFEAVHDLAKRYNVKSAVVDLRPNADSARAFQRAERYKVFLCEYTESPLNDAHFNNNTGIVKAYRTGIFDTSHRLIENGKFRFPRQSRTIDEFAQQLCNCVKSKKERNGKVVYRYEKTGNGNDHYRNALNYFILAASGHRIARVSNKYNNRLLVTDNNYARV
jgi:hypothetical protein